MSQAKRDKETIQRVIVTIESVINHYGDTFLHRFKQDALFQLENIMDRLDEIHTHEGG